MSHRIALDSWCFSCFRYLCVCTLGMERQLTFPLKWIQWKEIFHFPLPSIKKRECVQGYVRKGQLSGVSRAAEWEWCWGIWPGETHECLVSSCICAVLLKVTYKNWPSAPQADAFSLNIQTLKRICLLCSPWISPDLCTLIYSYNTHFFDHKNNLAFRSLREPRWRCLPWRLLFPFWLTSRQLKPFLITRNI